MQVTYVRDRFEAISTFAEKDIAKGAGFRWDPTGKRWWTTDVQRAQQLADYAQLAQTLVEKQAVIDAALDNPTARKHEPAFGSLLTVGDPATRKTSRADVTFEAESISPQEIAEVHGKLRILAGLDGDGAQIRNDVGFNKFDSSIGHSLASQETLTARQAALGRKLVQKYRRQLGG